MKEQKNNEIVFWINELNIKDELKQVLNCFNEKITELKKAGCKIKFDVIIDERSKEDIDILLEYVTKILEEQELYGKFVEYKNSTTISDISNSVIVVNNFDIFYNRILDYYSAEKKISDFMGNIRANNNMLILACTNKIDNYFKKISKEVFNPELCIHIKRNSTLELYHELLGKYDDTNIKHSLSYNKFLKVLYSLENKNNIYSIDYLYDYSVKKMLLNNNKIINAKTFEEFNKVNKKKNQLKFDNLIGLDNIKNELDSLYKYLSFVKKLKIKDDIYLNLFFLGNPGTGKTTVARMYADKLYKMGFIKNNKLIETVPNDLIGEYVGQTRETIREILNDAKGGVLFIDEAYLLYSSNYINGNNPYMEEAVVELIKYMEDPKNVVIFAGYPNEMKKVYDANPGIKSRIYKEIIFNDYTSKELYQILINDLKQKKLETDSKSKNKIIKYIDNMKQEKNFGNARSMLQLSQKMITNHANSGSKELLINAKDLPKVINEAKHKERMGFSIYD